MSKPSQLNLNFIPMKFSLFLLLFPYIILLSVTIFLVSTHAIQNNNVLSLIASAVYFTASLFLLYRIKRRIVREASLLLINTEKQSITWQNKQYKLNRYFSFVSWGCFIEIKSTPNLIFATDLFADKSLFKNNWIQKTFYKIQIYRSLKIYYFLVSPKVGISMLQQLNRNILSTSKID